MARVSLIIGLFDRRLKSGLNNNEWSMKGREREREKRNLSIYPFSLLYGAWGREGVVLRRRRPAINFGPPAPISWCRGDRELSPLCLHDSTSELRRSQDEGQLRTSLSLSFQHLLHVWRFDNISSHLADVDIDQTFGEFIYFLPPLSIALIP